MAQAIPSARKQRRGIETRRQLIESTKILLAGKDYRSITLDLISQHVGVAKSSILWHFGSKEALLTEAVYDLFDEIDRAIALDKRNLPTRDDRATHLLRTVADYHKKNAEAKGIVLSLMLSKKTPDDVRDRIRTQWRDHINKIGEYISGDDATVDAAFSASILALIHGHYLQWYLDGFPDDLPQRLAGSYMALAGRSDRGNS